VLTSYADIRKSDVSDFLARGFDGRLLAERQKTSSEEIGQNEHAHFVQFSLMRYLGQHLG